MNQATDLTHIDPIPTSSDLTCCGKCGEPYFQFTDADQCCNQPSGTSLAETLAAGKLTDTLIGAIGYDD